MRVLYIALVLCLAVHRAWSCQCFGNHIQNVMCEEGSGVVFKGDVTSVEGATSETGYVKNEVMIETVYKDMSGNLREGDTVNVLTPTDQGMCIITLSVGTYLIDASMDDDGVMKANGCTLTAGWPEETEDSATLTSTLADFDCSCEVRVCERPFAGEDMYDECLSRAAGDDECVMDKYGAYNDIPNCGTTFSLCVRQTPGAGCAWDPQLPKGCIESSSARRVIPSLAFTFVVILSILISSITM